MSNLYLFSSVLIYLVEVKLCARALSSLLPDAISALSTFRIPLEGLWTLQWMHYDRYLDSPHDSSRNYKRPISALHCQSKEQDFHTLPHQLITVDIRYENSASLLAKTDMDLCPTFIVRIYVWGHATQKFWFVRIDIEAKGLHGLMWFRSADFNPRGRTDRAEHM